MQTQTYETDPVHMDMNLCHAPDVQTIMFI
jgi:hypothetical protein